MEFRAKQSRAGLISCGFVRQNSVKCGISAALLIIEKTALERTARNWRIPMREIFQDEEGLLLFALMAAFFGPNALVQMPYWLRR